jgi:hypothetical protein
MDIRDQFAIAALQGMLASGHQEAIEQVWIATGESPARGLSMAAYGFADAMLAVRQAADVNAKKPRKERAPKTPVVMISTIPASKIRVLGGKLRYDLKDCCKAATWPWLNGVGKPGVFARCRNRHSAGDVMCKFHRRIADTVGIKTWRELQEEK